MAQPSILTIHANEAVIHEISDGEFNIPKPANDTIHWISVNKINDPTQIENALRYMDLDPALLADIQAPIQQPFDGDNVGCLLVKLPYRERSDENIEQEKTQIVFVLTNNSLLTCTDGDPKFLNRIHRNLIANRISLDGATVAHLFYFLMDGYNDNNYVQLKKFVREVNTLEEKLLRTQGDEDVFLDILNLRRKMSQFGDDLLVWGEFFNDLKTFGSAYLDLDTMSRFNNEMGPDMAYYWQEYRSEREDIKELLTIHDLFSSNRMNKTMQLLTVIATIFLPITFIVGWYGMNLQMPETKWPLMYPIATILMIAITLILIIWMKRRRMF